MIEALALVAHRRSVGVYCAVTKYGRISPLTTMTTCSAWTLSGASPVTGSNSVPAIGGDYDSPA
jgi:hypothetical protein